MDIPKEFEKYIISIDDKIKYFISSEINRLTFDEWFYKQCYYLNVNRIVGNQRANSTNSFIYKSNITNTLYGIFEYCVEESQIDFINKIVKIHNENLRYEEKNPIEYIESKVKQTRQRQVKSPKEPINKVRTEGKQLGNVIIKIVV